MGSPSVASVKKSAPRCAAMAWISHRPQIRIPCALVLFLVLLFAGGRLGGLRGSIRTGSSIGVGNFGVSMSRRCHALFDLSKPDLSRLETLNLKSCNLTSIPPSIGTATNLHRLDVSDNPSLATLPPEMIKCTKLSVLFSSSNPGMRTLPSVLGRMTSLTRLGWRSGSLTALQAESMPPNLVHLILTGNSITQLDDVKLFERMRYVRKLMLSHNQIRTLSAEGVGMMRSLELVRLGGNDLGSIPKELWSLPKLAWVTLSGNPRLGLEFRHLGTSEGGGDHATLPVLSSADLGPADDGAPGNDSLGQGASGTVTARIWDGKSVAVKIIHGVTSDGRAEDELRAYEALGKGGIKHHVVGCIALFGGMGTATGRNDQWSGKRGIVMDRLSPGMVDLALPPTIEEVTADRWWSDDDDDDNKDSDKWRVVARPPFSPLFVLSALRDLAKALLFLHGEVGLVHGDVYGHNVKVHPKTGQLYLLDLGASWATGSRLQQQYAQHAEKVEVRALGVLIGELAERIADTAERGEDMREAKRVQMGLERLGLECRNEDVKKRPTLQEVSKRLAELSRRGNERGFLVHRIQS